MTATFHASGNGGQDTGLSSFTITCTITAGDSIAIYAGWDAASTTTPTVATAGGTGSDSFTLVYGPVNDLNSDKVGVWLLQSAGTGRTGVTVSWASSNPAFAAGFAVSFTGLVAPTLDQFVVGGANANTGNTPTLTSADEIAFQLGLSTVAIASVNAPWTGDGPASGIENLTNWGGGHRILAATTPIASNFTNSSGNWQAYVWTFKAASTAAPFYKLWDRPQYDIPSSPPQQFVRDPSKFPNPIPFNDQQQRHTRQVPLVPPPQAFVRDPSKFPNPIPFNQTDWAPAKPFFKVSQQTQPYNLPLLNVIVAASPFYQTNWPIPKLQGPSVPFAQQNTLINLLAQPLIGPDLSTSKFLTPRAPDATQQTNINLFTNPIPFSQMDWSTTRFNPANFAQPQAYNLSLYTIVVAAPFFQTDWSTTRFQASRAPDLPPYNQALYTVTVQAAPFIPVDWSRPFFQRSLAPDQQSLNLNLFTNPLPFAKYDYLVPLQSPTAPMDRSQPPNINLSPPPPPVVSTELHDKPFFANVSKLMGQ